MRTRHEIKSSRLCRRCANFHETCCLLKLSKYFSELRPVISVVLYERFSNDSVSLNLLKKKKMCGK